MSTLRMFFCMCNCGTALLQLGRLLRELEDFFCRADGLNSSDVVERFFQQRGKPCLCACTLENEMNSFWSFTSPFRASFGTHSSGNGFQNTVSFLKMHTAASDCLLPNMTLHVHVHCTSLLWSGVGRQWFSQGFRYGDCRSLQHILQLCCYI